jgi:hypothetical protein
MITSFIMPYPACGGKGCRNAKRAQKSRAVSMVSCAVPDMLRRWRDAPTLVSLLLYITFTFCHGELTRDEPHESP